MIAASLLSGISLATFAASGLFFLKFWRASHDRFFLLFSIACWLIAFERMVAFFVIPVHQPQQAESAEASSWVYLIRLSAFLVVLAAIYLKNRPSRKA